MPQPTTHTTIRRISNNTITDADDVLAVEEPLEIRLAYGKEGERQSRNISVTMRTPGNDMELAVGFLFTEGIIQNAGQVSGINTISENIVQVVLQPDVVFDMQKLERNFYTTSSCGICGKASIDAVKTVCDLPDGYPYDSLSCAAGIIYSLPDILRKQQSVFEATGGIHACALFDTNGVLLMMREDVGRHNALDKLIGAAFNSQSLPLDKNILLLSGRASFELVQKAAMAGIKIIAAVGAPSSLAVQMAEDWNITLIGFLRGERFNIYSGAQRIKEP
jgi:FdhD protein